MTRVNTMGLGWGLWGMLSAQCSIYVRPAPVAYGRAQGDVYNDLKHVELLGCYVCILYMVGAAGVLGNSRKINPKEKPCVSARSTTWLVARLLANHLACDRGTQATTSCGRGWPGALWLWHGWQGGGGG